MAADTQAQANGVENGLEEEDLTSLRPADIDADVKEMERRKRVEMIMNSKLFREELERIIEMQMKDGNGPAGLLQQISDMMGIQAGKLHTTHMFRGSNCVTPINDIRGVESMAYAKGEKHLRCKLASVFRLMDLYGWSQGIHNQITVRLSQDEEHFLVNPYGMLYNEITASSLVKVDMQGNVVEPGTTNFGVNTQVFLLHSSIHASRPDVKCIIHIHTPSVLAVSSLKCGLLPLCQEALVVGEVSQHPFVSGIFEPEERDKIIRNLGPTNKILLLNNHGALCCGESVEEAFYNVYNTVLACETQIKLMPVGVENLVLVNDETRKQVYDAAHRSPDADGDKKGKHFRVGELDFEALMRMLDNAGFRTGYIYRHPLVKGEVPKPKNDVEVPPAVSSLGYLIEEEKLYKQGNWKKYVDGRNRLDRTKWLNSPNVYQKVEILETGTPDPKKITKWVDQNSEEWVAENSPTHSSTPVKIDSALQFVPKNTNPKEFKKLQQQIKENRRADKITSGPQSHILEGVTWEEAKKLQDANITQTGDQVILVGAASKGIIQRNFQHNALVYKTPYAKNPFDSISDKEIEDYKRLVERKQRGDTDYEESQSESEAISSRQEALRHIKSPLMSPQSATSETEEESRDEPRVLRIETKTAPQPIQAEVVLSDAEFDTTDARVERSQSARYPKAEKPESVTIVNSFRKSWSLKRDKDRNKDVDSPDECFSGTLDPSLLLTNFNTQPVEEPIQSCVARITDLKKTPIVIDVRSCDPDSGVSGGIVKSASEPSGLYKLSAEGSPLLPFGGCHTTDSSDSDSNLDLKRRLSLRKKMLYSAKMRFLGFDRPSASSAPVDGAMSPGSRIGFLISEIRDKISEIITPETVEACESLKWITRPKFVPREVRREVDVEPDNMRKDGQDVENDRQCDNSSQQLFDLDTTLNGKTDVRMDAHVIKSLLMELVHQVDFPEDATYTITDEAEPCSIAESTDTEWYYNKTILKPDNSQTVLEIKNHEYGGHPTKQSDTGIETDFTSEKERDSMSKMDEKLDETEVMETTALNKSSETDSSFLKSSSGRTSVDIDTSLAFKTETENSEKQVENHDSDNSERECCADESAEPKKMVQDGSCKLPDIPESPEFTNVDTEDAPVTSSSKDSSPEVIQECTRKEEQTEDRLVSADAIDANMNDDNNNEMSSKPEKKKKRKNKKRTKITVKKEVGDRQDPVVSEIKLTIKNSTTFATERYEFEIQDETNTSGEMSRTVSSLDGSVEEYQRCDIVESDCDCLAQQNLETLQSEVTDTIEKLQGIETFFENEIKKSSSVAEEFVITYNYKENGEVLARDARMTLEELSTVRDADSVIYVCENDSDANGMIVPDIGCTIEVMSEKEIDQVETEVVVAEPPDLKVNGVLDNDIVSEDVSLKPKVVNTINDVHDFILNDEESPTDSFEDVENVVSIAESVRTNDDDELLEEDDGKSSKARKTPGKSSTFNILVATPNGKEIFINYNGAASSSFSLAPDADIKCNSYINTDDVNEDFEDSPEWFSVGSPEKASGNTSFDSAVSNFEDGSSPACSCGDEYVGTTANGENTFNGDHSDAHQSTFSHSSKEGSPTKDRSMEESPKKEKKKKKGLRTPSFLKKKKEKKKVEA